MKKTIVIADDDPAIVESLTFILEEFGYNIKSTGDGNKIYKMITKIPDLLLLDIWMSGQDGRQICKELKKKDITKHMPIILISAGRDIKKSADDSGADDYLAKPFTMENLIEKVEKWTNNSKKI